MNKVTEFSVFFVFFPLPSQDYTGPKQNLIWGTQLPKINHLYIIHASFLHKTSNIIYTIVKTENSYFTLHHYTLIDCTNKSVLLQSYDSLHMIHVCVKK